MMEALHAIGIFLLVVDTLVAICLTVSFFDGWDGWPEVMVWLVTSCVAVGGWTLVS